MYYMKGYGEISNNPKKVYTIMYDCNIYLGLVYYLSSPLDTALVNNYLL